MGRIYDFASVCTKARLMYGKMITKEQFMKLSSCKDYIDTVTYLKNYTNYSSILKDYDLKELQREELERILIDCYIQTVSKMKYHLKGNYKRAFEVLIFKYSIKVTDLNKSYFDSIKALYKILNKESSNILKKIVSEYEALIRIKDNEKVYEEVKKYKSSNGLDGDFKETYVGHKEIMLNMKTILKKYMVSGNNNIGVVIAFMELLMMEVKDIITVVEGKWYRLSKDQIMKYTIYFSEYT